MRLFIYICFLGLLGCPMDKFDEMISAKDFPEQLTKYVRTLNIEQCMQHRLFFMKVFLLIFISLDVT